MEENKQDRIQKTLDFIEKDRIIPEDPWFYSRLMTRMKGETEQVRKVGLFGVIRLRPRPILAVIVVMIGITGGIGLGKIISNPENSIEQGTPVFSIEQDATTAFFNEISGADYEQILFMK